MPRESISVRVPVPSPISPAHVVATLQTFEPLLDNHHYVISYRPKAGPISCKDFAVIKGDPFFQHECRDLSPASADATGTERSKWWISDVWEDVYWVPFVVPYFSRLKRYLAIGCKTEGGIRFRQRVSGGVVTRGTFTVVERETGLPCAIPSRERAHNEDNDCWDGDTEKGSILSNSETGRANEDEDESSERRDDSGRGGAATREKGISNWDAQDETDTETESTWEILCECEIEMPLILIVSQFFRRDANRELCKHICRSIIYATITEHDEYRILESTIMST
ncbi:hypothetical protein F4808DRAFT_457633 [Astrocystis sublimbata]|nr:hypothetical protein F4808DRAFT_457633 [Astrocystis sublimbata]